MSQYINELQKRVKNIQTAGYNVARTVIIETNKASQDLRVSSIVRGQKLI